MLKNNLLIGGYYIRKAPFKVGDYVLVKTDHTSEHQQKGKLKSGDVKKITELREMYELGEHKVVLDDFWIVPEYDLKSVSSISNGNIYEIYMK